MCHLSSSTRLIELFSSPFYGRNGQTTFFLSMAGQGDVFTKAKATAHIEYLISPSRQSSGQILGIIATTQACVGGIYSLY